MPWRGLLRRLTDSLSRKHRGRTAAVRLERLEDRLVPVTTAMEAPLVSASTSFPVRWSGFDPDGIAGFDVYVSTDGGPFVLWQDDADLASAVYPGRVGSRYAFKVVGTDILGNVGEESNVATSLVISPASLTLKRDGADVDVINPATGRLVASRPADDPGRLWLYGSDAKAESYMLDLSAGALSAEVEISAGTGAGDRMTVVGTGSGTATLDLLTSGRLYLPGTSVTAAGFDAQQLSGYQSLEVIAPFGDNAFTVSRPRAGRNTVSGLGLVPLTFFGVRDFAMKLGDDAYPPTVSGVTVTGGWSASGLQNVTITGGPGDDTLTDATSLLRLPVAGGTYRFEGGGGTNTVSVAGNADWLLSDDTVSNGGGQLRLASVQVARIAGGARANRIDASGFSGTTFLTGRGGNDTITGGSGFDWLVESGDVNFTLTPGTLTGGGRDALSSIDGAMLTGGAGPNRIDTTAFLGPVRLDGRAGNDTLRAGSGDDLLTGGTGVNRLDGGLGIDAVVESGDVDFTLTDARIIGRGIDLLAFFETAILTGGAGDNTFTVSNWSSTATLDGGGGTDAILAYNDAEMTLSDTTLTRTGYNVVSFTRIEVGLLLGADGPHTLNASAFTGRVVISGGGGDDTLVAGPGRALVIGGDGGDTLTGGDDEDVLIAGRTPFDANATALMALMAEWGRLDRTTAERIAALRTGRGLNTTRYRLSAATVRDDDFTDTLRGNGGSDWFWLKLPPDFADVLLDDETGETIN